MDGTMMFRERLTMFDKIEKYSPRVAAKVEKILYRKTGKIISKGDVVKFFNRYSPFKYMPQEKLENTKWQVQDIKKSKWTGKPLAVLFGAGEYHTLDSGTLSSMISKGKAVLAQKG